MRVKIYIVTYNDNNALYENLNSLMSSDIDENVEINVINNYSHLVLEEKYSSVNVLNNSLRPDFSRGHLSRNWNQSLINGFKNLNKPDCDLVVTTQDDIYWEKDWLTELKKIHENYTFYSADWGDNLCSYTPEFIKTVGLWDERFCGITFQEADYFLRAALFNYEKSSINDFHHKRVLNPDKLIVRRQNENYRQHNGRNESHQLTERLFKIKWHNMHPENWDLNQIRVMNKKAGLPNFVLYPYFENLINRENGNYL